MQKWEIEIINSLKIYIHYPLNKGNYILIIVLESNFFFKSYLQLDKNESFPLIYLYFLDLMGLLNEKPYVKYKMSKPWIKMKSENDLHVIVLYSFIRPVWPRADNVVSLLWSHRQYIKESVYTHVNMKWRPRISYFVDNQSSRRIMLLWAVKSVTDVRHWKYDLTLYEVMKFNPDAWFFLFLLPSVTVSYKANANRSISVLKDRIFSFYLRPFFVNKDFVATASPRSSLRCWNVKWIQSESRDFCTHTVFHLNVNRSVYLNFIRAFTANNGQMNGWIRPEPSWIRDPPTSARKNKHL